MHESHNSETIPGILLLGLLMLIAMSLTAVVAVVLVAPEDPESPVSASIVGSRDLLFEDLGGGRVAIYDSADGALVETLAAGSDNFIRGVLRGLARERRGFGADAATPFRLLRLDDGRILLRDLATGRVLTLQAFGRTNVLAFARLLDRSPADTRRH